MTSENSVQLAQPYTRLEGLRQNLPDTPFTEGGYGDDLHEILEELENTSSIDLGKYRPRTSSFQRDERHDLYLVDCRYLKMKADALLVFFP
jgi:hypothetical protein